MGELQELLLSTDLIMLVREHWLKLLVLTSYLFLSLDLRLCDIQLICYWWWKVVFTHGWISSRMRNDFWKTRLHGIHELEAQSENWLWLCICCLLDSYSVAIKSLPCIVSTDSSVHCDKGLIAIRRLNNFELFHWSKLLQKFCNMIFGRLILEIIDLEWNVIPRNHLDRVKDF